MKRGFTLVEVLITLAVFGLVMAFTAAVLFVKRPIQETSELQSDAYRGVLLGMEHLRSELATALVDPVEADAPTLSYRLPERDPAGQVLLSATGEARYGDPVVVSLSQNGFVTRGARPLCYLGPAGSLAFSRRPGQQDLVTITMKAHLEGHEYEVTGSVGLQNQR